MVSGTVLWTVDPSEGYEFTNASSWDRRVAVDGEGSAYVIGELTSGGTSSLLVRKYSGDGDSVWSHVYDPEAGSVISGGISASATGEVVFAATLIPRDGFVRRLDTSGAEDWTRTITSPAENTAIAVALASDDSVIVGGGQGTYPNSFDQWLGRYDDGGDLLWSDVTSDFAGAWLDASIDANGDVFTCGDEHGRRHTANGVSIWTASWTSEECYGVAATGDGGAIAVGAADGDAWLRRLDDEGEVVWHETYDSPDGGTSDVGVDVVFDGDNIVVVGRRSEAGSDRAIWIAKYTLGGEQLWEQAVMGSGAENGGEGVAVDGSGNIFASGYLEAPGGVNLWLRKLTP